MLSVAYTSLRLIKKGKSTTISVRLHVWPLTHTLCTHARAHTEFCRSLALGRTAMRSGTRLGTGLAGGFAAPLPPELRGQRNPVVGAQRGGSRAGGSVAPVGTGLASGLFRAGAVGVPMATVQPPKGHPMATPLGAPWPGSAGSQSHRARAPRPTGSPCCAPLPFPPLPSPPLPSLSSPPLRPPLPSPASGARSFSSSFLSFFLFFFSHIDAAGGREPARRTARVR